MPWIGTAPNQTTQRSDGIANGSDVWAQAKAASRNILSNDHDVHDQDVITMLNQCLKNDGGNAPVADIPMSGFTLTGLGAPSGDAAAARFIDTRNGQYVGPVGGTGDAIILTPAIPLAAYVAGTILTFKAIASNTGATTVAVSGLTPKAIARNDGAATALIAGDILINQLIIIAYDGAQWLLISRTGLNLDDTLEFSGSDLQRAALSGAIAAAAGSNATTMTIDMVVTIGDGVNVITAGTKGYLPIDFAATILGWKLVGLQSGSCVIDVWKAAGAVPTNGNTITGSEKPTLASAQFNSDTSLSTWTTSVADGDVFGFEVESAVTVTQVTLVIKMTKTG